MSWDQVEFTRGEAVRVSLGWDPFTTHVASVGWGMVPDPMAGLRGDYTAVDWKLVDALDEVRQLRDSRQKAEIARRVGLPFSEVEARWSSRDLAMERAVEALQAEEAAERCPSCGMRHEDVTDPATGRLRADVRAKVEEMHCPMCERLQQTEDQLYKERRPPGRSLILTARQAGEGLVLTVREKAAARAREIAERLAGEPDPFDDDL